MNIIETRALTKKFKEIIAVDRVSLSIREGEVFGLLGPNGAGKTTLLSMLVTLKAPSGGSAQVNGVDIVSHSSFARSAIGIVFQDPSLDEDLTARENLELHAVMYGVPSGERAKRIAEAIGVVELTERLDDVVKTFSGGMRRRLEIARSLLHYPKVLFLDEPTLGLDPQTRQHVWEYIRKLKKEKNITIVLTTHYLEEADSLCDRVAIIDHGKIVALDTPGVLKASLGGDVVELTTADNEKFIAAAGKKKGVSNAQNLDGKVFLRVSDGEKQIPHLLEIARENGLAVESVNLRKPTLEDVFLHFTGRQMREEGASARDRMRLRVNAMSGRK